MDWNLLIAGVAVSISVITAAGCVAVLILMRREPPDISELKARLLALDQEVTDVNDRLGQWMRRESVRAMRAGKELANEQRDDTIPVDKKADLRRRAQLARSNA